MLSSFLFILRILSLDGEIFALGKAVVICPGMQIIPSDTLQVSRRYELGNTKENHTKPQITRASIEMIFKCFFVFFFSIFIIFWFPTYHNLMYIAQASLIV